MTSWNGNQNHWNLSLWEAHWEEGVRNLFAQLADNNVVPQGNDEIVWRFGLMVLRGPSPSSVFVILFMKIRVVLIFQPRLFESQKLLRKLALLCGQPASHQRTNSHRTHWGGEIFICQVGVLCALMKKNRSITSLCIVIGLSALAFGSFLDGS